MTARTTTLLGVEYPGRPMFGSLALYLVNLEQREGREAAQRSLDAHNKIRTAFGGDPIDLAGQFTLLPMEGLVVSPAGGKRDIDRVVERTAKGRRAA